MTIQLGFTLLHNDNRPLPEIIADGGPDWVPFPLQFVDHDGQRYYAVRDWIAGVALAPNPADFWNKMKARARKDGQGWVDMPSSRPYVDTTGRRIKTDYTTAEGLYAITQRMGANTGVANRILAYLAKAGVTLDEYRLTPSKAIDAGVRGMLGQGVDPKKVKARAEGILARNVMTQAAQETHIAHRPNYAALTAHTYEKLFGRSKAALVKALNLTPQQADRSFRDHLDVLALKALEAAELAVSAKMQQTGRPLTDQEQLEIVDTAAGIVAPSFYALAVYVGTDLVTGRPLLSGGAPNHD